MSNDRDTPGKSITWVVRMTILLVAVFGWGVMAAEYAKRAEGWNPLVQERGVSIPVLRPIVRLAAADGFARFAANAVVQLPNAPAVIWFNIRELPWLPLGIVVVEGLVVAAGVGMRRLEKHLDQPPRR